MTFRIGKGVPSLGRTRPRMLRCVSASFPSMDIVTTLEGDPGWKGEGLVLGIGNSTVVVKGSKKRCFIAYAEGISSAVRAVCRLLRYGRVGLAWAEPASSCRDTSYRRSLSMMRSKLTQDSSASAHWATASKARRTAAETKPIVWRRRMYSKDVLHDKTGNLIGLKHLCCVLY